MSDLQQYESKMNSVIDNLDRELSQLRAGRANPKILDRINVDYYGVPTPLAQVANITVPEARLLEIKPWDISIIKDVEKAIIIADLNLNPINDGKMIRLQFPELTEQKRKELTKEVKSMGENSKVAIRNVRRDAMDYFKKQQKENEITEDMLKDVEDDIQNLTDKYVNIIDKDIHNKNTDIMTI